ncbi:MAG: helix-turn-helix domain-containing protein [Syntrophothermus sp.]
MDNNLYKLCSISEVMLLLQVSRATLMSYINEGKLGIVPPSIGFKRIKVPHKEISRFLTEEVVREKRNSLSKKVNRTDVNEFINRSKKRDNLNYFDSKNIFNKIMEESNGQCLS